MLALQKEKQIIDYLTNNLNANLIYIFGSYSKNKERNDSDLDIAILTDSNIDNYQLFLHSQKLAETLGKEVDLIDLKKSNTVFNIQVIQGKLIYNNNNLKKMKFELKILREYAKLNEERREILQKVTSGGNL